MPWQPTPILFPDTEEVACDVLRELLAEREEAAGVEVCRTLPKSRPARVVQIIRDGGDEAGFRDRARLRFLIWDETDEAVADLTRLVVALVPLMAGRSSVLYTRRLSGPYEIPDVAPKRYLLFEIHFRGEALS